MTFYHLVRVKEVVITNLDSTRFMLFICGNERSSESIAFNLAIDVVGRHTGLPTQERVVPMKLCQSSLRCLYNLLVLSQAQKERQVNKKRYGVPQIPHQYITIKGSRTSHVEESRQDTTRLCFHETETNVC